MLRQELTMKGRAFLVAGTLCVGLAAAGTALTPAGTGSDLLHFARGVLYGLGVTLNIASWFVGRTA